MALRADALHPTHEICPSCRGSGEDAAIQPSCRQCGATWDTAVFDRWIETHDRPRWFRINRYRWRCTLPCGHDLETALSYVAQLCGICHGVGTVSHFRMADMLMTDRLCLLPSRSGARLTPRNPRVPPITALTPRIRQHEQYHGQW